MGFAAAIPGIVGILGSLFGGKRKDKNKAQYSTTMDPYQQKMYQQMMPMIMKMFQQRQQGGMSSPYGQAQDLISRSFFNKPYQGQ